MNTKLRMEAKYDFEIDFFKSRNNFFLKKQWRMKESIKILS